MVGRIFGRFLRRCATAWLMWLLVFGLAPMAVAQPSSPPASTPEPTPDQIQTSPTKALPQASPQPAPRGNRKGQRVTYPDPPDVYDYESLRQYDEEIYGEREMLEEGRG